MSGAVNLVEYLERSRRRFAARTAVVDSRGESLSYSQLHDQANSVAGFLAAKGVNPGDRVGVIGPKSAASVTALFGVMTAGAAYVPADFTAPATRNRTLLADCAVKAVFLDPRCSGVLEGWPLEAMPEVVWLPSEAGATVPATGSSWVSVVRHAALARPRLVGADGLAYILYTSGSTGMPKGVTLTQENATSFVDWCSDAFLPTEQDRFSSHAPFHFDLSVFDLYVSLKHGATLYLISEDLGKNPSELAKFVAANRLTVWYSTPSILSLLAQFGDLDNHNCGELRLVLFAGEVFPVKHLRNIVESWPQAAFYNLYGPTETNVCTFAKIPATIPPERTVPYPIGQLCTHCEGRVLDVPGGKDVPRGGEGLLHIAGRSLFQGYWNRPDPDLFFERDGRRWYNTGDVVRETEEDGYIYVGRRDRMVKRRGYRIELGEIERGLYQNTQIREAAVIAVPDASSSVRIVAYVASQPGQQPTIISLKTFCGRALPAYMSPDMFVILDALPRTSTDKIDYQSLVRTSEAKE